jgi:tRNA G46 methylase TrmB
LPFVNSAPLADVLGVDIASNLVEAENKRAKEQGLTNCTKDHTFDLVV